MLVLYGLGTTIGGGIYVLIGAIIGRAGIYTPLSFVVAALMVTFTALSFGELSARFPKSAGEAVFIREGLNSQVLAIIVGYLVIANGVVSSAALVNGFVGYFQVFVSATDGLVICGLMVLIGGLACWGIGQSMLVAAITTLIEIAGLGLIIWVGRDALLDLPGLWVTLTPIADSTVWSGIFSGAFLAFFAFIGFEDMVNVAEEVKNPKRNMPLAIILTLAITTLLYLVISVIVVASAPLAELAASPTPLQLVYQQRTGSNGDIISLISIAAVLNGVLILVIMGARVLYGMAAKGWSAKLFGRIHAHTRTPVAATLTVVILTTLLALTLKLEALAQITSLVMLTISTLVNAALVSLKYRPQQAAVSFNLPVWVPLAGFVISAGFSFFVALDLVQLFNI
ncbi:MAG: amino acid permease [Rhodospirillales bacterium]|nr:amino acid permease [Rhodospirillales bacterium]